VHSAAAFSATAATATRDACGVTLDWRTADAATSGVASEGHSAEEVSLEVVVAVARRPTVSTISALRGCRQNLRQPRARRVPAPSQHAYRSLSNTRCRCPRMAISSEHRSDVTGAVSQFELGGADVAGGACGSTFVSPLEAVKRTLVGRWPPGPRSA
jgi:hypothetical protein